MLSQAPASVLMIRPSSFGFNPETRQTNAFQKDIEGVESGTIQESALREFNRLVKTLRNSGVVVHVFDDTPSPRKPDAIFPNNWVSFHHDGTVVLYPMMAANRRWERRLELLTAMAGKHHCNISRILDLTAFELEGKYLEGTGSIVFDYPNRTAYAVLSPRTDSKVLSLLCKDLDYREICFNAKDRSGKDIYHANVIMCIGTGYVIICMDAINDRSHKKMLMTKFGKSSLEVININMDQMLSFAGNMIEVIGNSGDKFLVMSKSSYTTLTAGQIRKISEFAKPVYESIPTIEGCGGGSVRCMMAANFLPTLFS